MPADPELIARQRELIRHFRAAHHTRTSVEAETTARRQSQQQNSDTALAETTKAAQTRRDQLVGQADERLKSIPRDVTATFDALVKQARTLRKTAYEHRDDALRLLSNAGLPRELGITVPTQAADGDSPLAALQASVLAASGNHRQVFAGVQALSAQRGPRNALPLLIIATVVTLLLVVGLRSCQGARANETNQSSAKLIVLVLSTTSRKEGTTYTFPEEADSGTEEATVKRMTDNELRDVDILVNAHDYGAQVSMGPSLP